MANLMLKIKNFVAKDERGRRFMKVEDKIKTVLILNDDRERICPPHRIPHTPPFVGEKVTDEYCHIHATKWRYYSHHLIYCITKKCPHLPDMESAHKRYFVQK